MGLLRLQCVRVGVVWTFFPLIYLCSLPPSLWETAWYRLKNCLKGLLHPKQPLNKHKKGLLWNGRPAFCVRFDASSVFPRYDIDCKHSLQITVRIYIFYPITLESCRGPHRWIRNNPSPSCPVFSCPSWADKVHSGPLFDIVFPPLLLSASFFLFPFTLPCRIVFAKPVDLETWPVHLSFHFLTRVRSS